MKNKLAHWFDCALSYVYTRRIWGPRCPDYYEGCPCCEKWKTHDFIAGNDHG